MRSQRCDHESEEYMAQSKTENADSAEKAYADASAEVKPAKGKLVDSLKADVAENTAKSAAPAAKAEEAPAKQENADKPVAKKALAKKTPAKKAAPKKSASKKAASAKKPAAKTAAVKKKSAAKSAKPASAKKAPAKKAAAKTKPTVTQLKETIMATKTTDYTTAMTDTMNDAVKEMQDRAQAAYDKGTAAMTEATDFAKGNVEAVVESGKILAEGVQGVGKTWADEAKSAYETATADLKEMAAIKSPTELFQLQGKILRRNFDAMVAVTSKNTDAAMKLANDTMAPLSGRVNVAAEKLSKVA